MKTWKKNVVAAAVLVTVCAGIYINWVYTEEQSAANLTDTLDGDKILSADTLVMSNGDSLPVDAEGENSTMTDYFAAVRLSRQEARDSAVGMLQEAMAYNENVEAAQSNAKLEQIVEIALCEAQIESLVIAKGYADCVAYIGNEGISVAVASPEGGIQQKDVALITDVVLSQSEFAVDDIRVVEVQ